MQISELEEKIKANCINEAIKLIDEIGCRKDVQEVPLLIYYLVETDNNGLRNAIAVALSDIGSVEAVEPIVKMLKHPKTLRSRGTLLYALEAFDCSDYSELITELLFEDSFEVSRQSFLLLEANVDRISPEKKQKCIEKIQRKMDSLNDKIEFLSESLNVLMDE